jgi:hypothetical protein
MFTTGFAYYFTTAPILVVPVRIGSQNLISELELTRGRTAWSALFQTSIRKLSGHDAQLLKCKMERAAEQPRLINEFIERMFCFPHTTLPISYGIRLVCYLGCVLSGLTNGRALCAFELAYRDPPV